MKKRVRILKFKKNGYINLDSTPEFNCNVIQCGKDRFTLRDFQLQHGHDDSLPYTAILCLNDNPVCRCTNDGWGGQTDINPLDIKSSAILKSIEGNINKYGWSYMGTKFQLDLDFIANTLAETEHINMK